MLEKIPFIFKNRDLTIPANKILRDWLLDVLNNEPKDLLFLYRKSQEYTKHGGANTYSFDSWLRKIRKDVDNVKF